MGLRYDSIGKGYANQRQAEPRWERTIHNALDGSQSLLNVGAGTGNYEPPTRVVAVEPSIEMIRQRTNSHPCIQGVAEALPFADGTFDAAMAILTLHHWSDVAAGLAELRRVADRQVIFLFESLESHSFWLLDYFPEILRNAVEQNAPTVEFVGQHLNVVDVQTLWIPEDCVDGVAAAHWKRPELYLEPVVQSSMSALALLSSEQRARGAALLERDIANGTWAKRNRNLADMTEADFGYRLVIAEG